MAPGQPGRLAEGLAPRRRFVASPDCIPCALRQILSCARRVSDDAWFQSNVLKQVCAALAEIDLKRNPAEVTFDAHRAASRLLGCKDPYADEKKTQNARMLELLPELRRKVAESTDPIGLAARLAVAGNSIDLGILRPSGAEPLAGLAFGSDADVRAEIERALKEPLALDDIPALREAARAAKSIVYVLDNAGEIVLDRLLIEQFKRKDVTCIVRSAPILNDAMMEDARVVGLPELCQVLEAGAPMLGLTLSLASPDVQERFLKADLVIAKGQANLETLFDCEREVFFLLRAKCAVMAAALGVPVGAAVAVRKEPLPPPGQTAPAVERPKAGP